GVFSARGHHFMVSPKSCVGKAELHLRSPDQHLVAVAELHRSDDALSVEEGAIRGTQVAQDVVVPLAVDLAVLAGDLAIAEPDRCRGGPSEHAAVAQRVFGDFGALPLEDQPGCGRDVRRGRPRWDDRLPVRGRENARRAAGRATAGDRLALVEAHWTDGHELPRKSKIPSRPRFTRL